MAAVTSQSWSVVGKSTKKTKQTPQALTKDQKKSFISKMPRIEAQAPVKESSTIYDAFLGKSSSDKAVSNSAKNAAGEVVKKNVVNKKKKTEPNNEKKKEKPLPFEEVISKIDRNDLASVLTKSQTSFPGNKDVWLKDLASYLNLKMERVAEPDPVFRDKPKDFPLSKLESRSKDLIMNTLKTCDPATIEHLYYHCIQTMLTEMGKGVSTYGYRIFLQCLAWQRPSVASSKVHQYLELLKGNQNRPVKCLSILWALGLGGVKDLRAGLRVWLDLMLPMTSVRPLASYPVEYIGILLQHHKDHKSAYGVMTIRDFFPVLDLVFSNSMNLPHDLQKKLVSVYPQIKTIAFGADPKSSLRLFFPSFLSRATSDARSPLKNEVLPCLVTCLMTDKMCFSVWRQMYIKHLPQSSVLLEHLSKNWATVSRQLEKKLLHETLRSFSVTNDELTSQGHHGPEETGCGQLCKELLSRMGQTTVFSWFWVLFLVVGLVAAIIAYDVYTSYNFRVSRTWRFLEEYGILAVLQQGWIKVSAFTQKVLSWLQVNIPFYYARTCEAVGPYFRQTKDKLIEWYWIVYDATKVQRQWITAKTLQFISWAYHLSPAFWEQAQDSCLTAWQVARDYLLLIWQFLVYYCKLAYVWIIEHLIANFSFEKVVRLMSSLLLKMQAVFASIVQWCITTITTMTA
ncbi:transmembrane protein 214-B-like [Liolophura sinensis]|uniref:transmembrane protein 214-B-like n=1 Tax=Liolophura sinensis TaxID=3198878 RepID=UPI0031598EF5